MNLKMRLKIQQQLITENGIENFKSSDLKKKEIYMFNTYSVVAVIHCVC
jgi:hypothetical protein